MDIIKAILDGQAGLDGCKKAMSEALRGVIIKALVTVMMERTLSGDATNFRLAQAFVYAILPT